MKKFFRIHIKADTDEEVKEELRDVAYIITGLRIASEKCKRSYKTDLVRDREKWEEKADAWIKKHQVFYNG